ncbi:LXG domain-containing protein [Candidatus Gracilibacteria bacterium]|nr:LXG domain-containing protein [Candidatus Gracilibacteria bacterium]
MKNIAFSLLSVFVLYIILIFVSPATANVISTALGITNLQQTIVELKAQLDATSTGTSSGSLLSGALDLQQEIIDGFDDAKDKIDAIRETLYKIEDTYNTLATTYTEVSEVVQTIGSTVDAVQSAIGTGSTQ